jgi:hypothetical protein
MGCFKNALIVLDDVREFGTSRAAVESSSQTVHIHYHLQDDKVVTIGTLSFRCDNEDEFRRRILAAATSVRHGEFQMNFDRATEILRGGLKPHALRILTNSDGWRLVGHISKTDKV